MKKMNDKFFCRTCKAERNHQELFIEKIRGSELNDSIQWIETYHVIQCMGCDTISFLKIYGDTEMVTSNYYGEPEYYDERDIYPLYLSQGKELGYQYLLPPTIKRIYQETIIALKANLSVLTAGGLRAIIEAICNHLKIKNESLAKRIDLLHSKGHLTKNESKRLHAIRFLGNDALHEMEVPKREHLFILLEIVNHLLQNLFINDKIVKGTLDTMIDTYDDFFQLLQKKITKDMVGEVSTLKSILGKSIRLFKIEDLNQFENELITSIKDGNIEFLQLEKDEEIPVYKILKESNLSFDWF